MIPSNYRLVYSKTEIEKTIAALGKQITPWVKELSSATGQDVTAIPLMHGGIFFYADLSRCIGHSLNLNPVRASAYAGNSTQGELRIDFDAQPVRGRAVLLADEICESGRTLAQVTKLCLEAGAVDVKQAVLVKREGAGDFEPSYVGYRYVGAEWLVGYGMDDNERFRNLPDVYRMEK